MQHRRDSRRRSIIVSLRRVCGRPRSIVLSVPSEPLRGFLYSRPPAAASRAQRIALPHLHPSKRKPPIHIANACRLVRERHTNKSHVECQFSCVLHRPPTRSPCLMQTATPQQKCGHLPSRKNGRRSCRHPCRSRRSCEREAGRPRRMVSGSNPGSKCFPAACYVKPFRNPWNSEILGLQPPVCPPRLQS